MILINKFRTKYNVRADVDDFDQLIKREVENLLLTGQMNEASLNGLDKRLAEIAPNKSSTHHQ